MTIDEETIGYSSAQVRCSLQFNAESWKSARSDFERLMEFITVDIGMRYPATRFVLGVNDWPARMRLLERLDSENSSYESPKGGDALDLEFKHLPLEVEVVGTSEGLIRERFENWVTSVEKIVELSVADGYPTPDFRISGPLSISGICSQEINSETASDLYPGWQSWSSDGDLGRHSEMDILTFRYLSLERVLSVETSDDEEAIRSFEEFAEHVDRVLDDPYQWRWAIEALHSALQASFVLALKGTWDVRTWKKGQARKALERQHEPPDFILEATAQLDWFPNLYSKIKDEQMMRQHTHSRTFVPRPGDESEDLDVEWLGEMRNTLKHFRAQTMCLGVESFPRHCSGCLRVAEFLINESNNVTWRGHRNELRVKDVLEKASSTLDRVERKYTERRQLLESTVSEIQSGREN